MGPGKRKEESLAYVEVVIVVAHVPEAVRVAADVDDAAVPGREHFLHDQVGEKEMAQVVGLEIALEPILRLGVGQRCDTGVVDHHVDGFGVRIDLGGGLLARPERREVEAEHSRGHVRGHFLDFGGRSLGLAGGSPGQDKEIGRGLDDGFYEVCAQSAEGHAGCEHSLAFDIAAELSDERVNGHILGGMKTSSRIR